VPPKVRRLLGGRDAFPEFSGAPKVHRLAALGVDAATFVFAARHFTLDALPPKQRAFSRNSGGHRPSPIDLCYHWPLTEEICRID